MASSPLPTCIDSHHGVEVDESEVVKFYSGASRPYCMLSNFHETPVAFEGVTYPSSEHAYQATHVERDAREALFGAGSDIGALTTDAFRLLGVNKGEKQLSSVTHWGRKRMVGILAKMRIRSIGKLPHEPAVADALFKEILLAKFKQSEAHRAALLSTGDAYLLEFDRAAFRKAGEPPRWGGGVRDGRVVGHNEMGALMMWVRRELRSQGF